MSRALAGAAVCLCSQSSVAQEIRLTGPLLSASDANGLPPTQRTHLELTLGPGVLGEGRVGGAPIGGATTIATSIEALVLAGWHGPAIGAAFAAGPTLRPGDARALGAIALHAGYAVISSDRDGVDWLEQPARRLYPVVFLELGAAGRWALVDAGPTRFGLGPRAGAGISLQRGRDTVFGVGADLSLLRDTSASGPLTLAASVAWRIGWDLSMGHSPWGG